MIVLLSYGTKTPVILIDGMPDLSKYDEPTLSILQSSFDAGSYEIIPDPEPINETPSPNWDGLYQALMISSVYYTLVGIGEQIDAVDGALDKTIDAIQYGIFKPDSVAAMPAFQSAINLLLLRLTNSELELSTEQIAEVRGVLDTNGFNSIQLQ